jgi:hypothetical protein
LYCLCTTYAFVCSLCCLCTTYGFPLVIILSLHYFQLSFGHCIVSVLLTAFVWSLYCLCTTYGFRLVIVLCLYFLRFPLVIVLSLCYLRLSPGYCTVSVLLTDFVCSLYCPCTTYGFRLVIVLSLYYLRLLFVYCIFSVLLTAAVCHCFVSVLLTALVWSLNCLCNTYGFPLVIVLSLCYLRF